MSHCGNVYLRRRRTIRSTGGSSKTHGTAQDLDDKLPEVSKHFQCKEWKTSGVDSFKRYRKWSEEEDEIVVQMVNLHGPKNWSTIACAVPGRSGYQCRERWVFYLDPALNKQPWSEQEDITLVRAHKVYGNNWSELAKLFPGRTNKAVKNHWFGPIKRKMKSYLSRRLLDDSLVPKNGDLSTLESNQDASKNNELPFDLAVKPKSEQGPTETSENTRTVDGQSSGSLNSEGFGTLSVGEGFGTLSVGVAQNYFSSSVDLGVSVAAPTVRSSVKNENPTSSAKLPTNWDDTGLSSAGSSQSCYVHVDEICGTTDPELPEVHLESIADLLDMSYCENMMVIPPD